MKKFIAGTALLLVLLALFGAKGHAKPQKCPYDIGLSIYYETCADSRQKQFFDDLYDAIRRGDESVAVPAGMTSDQVRGQMDTLFNECSELCAYDM